MREMHDKTVDYAKGETPMTDLQFKAFLELQNKYDDLLHEVNQIRRAKPRRTDEGMTDYQFQRYEKMRSQCEEMNREIAQLREENARLKVHAEVLKGLKNERK